MRKRRITILVVALLILALCGSGAFMLRQKTLDDRALVARATGMKAAEAGDHTRTLDQVGRYLLRFGQDEDAEAMFTYANARSKLPLPNNKHLAQAISLLRKTLAVDSQYTEARRRLLELYLEVGYGEETLKLAQEILASDPNDLAALRAEATAYAWRGNYDEAIERTAAITAIDPQDVENHVLALTLLQRAGVPKSELLAYADDQSGLDPESARYQLLQSVAYELAGDRTAASEWATRAADNAPLAPEFVKLVNLQLNNLNQFGASLNLLKRAVATSDDAELKRALVRRLYVVGDTEGVLDRTGEGPPESLDTALLEVRTLALAAESSTDEIEAIARELEGREDDPRAQAWAPVIRAMWVDEGRSPRELVELCRQATQRGPDNPFLHYLEGLAHERQAEWEPAIDAFKTTVKLEPAWVDPIIRAARLLQSLGRMNEAAGLAASALNRAPHDFSALVSASEILSAHMDALPPSAERQLFQLVERIQTASPGEPRTLPIYVELLARNGDRDKAKRTVEESVFSNRNVPPNTLLRLARVSSEYELGLTEQINATLDTNVDASPAAAYARAVVAHEAGDTTRGRRELTAAAEAAGNTSEWKAVRAEYLERIDAEDAVSAWAEAADAVPSNSRMQRRILESEHAWRDTALIRRVIDRLKEQTGADGVAWRVAEARWLLETNSSTKAIAEATVMLKAAMDVSVPRPELHVLMAMALERLGNTDTAVEHLTTAAQLAPDSTGIKVELARMLHEQGANARASRVIDEVLRSGSATDAERRRIADLLAKDGERERAIAVLRETYPQDERANPPDLMLARLYRETGRIAEAESICRRLLLDAPSPDAVQLAAEVYAIQGRGEEARRALALLDEMTLGPGVRQIILAEHTRKFGDGEVRLDEAARLYKAALAANESNASWWRRYVSLVLENQRTERVVDLIAAAYSACPDDDALGVLHGNRELLGSVIRRPVASRLLSAGLENPDRLDEAIEALHVLNRAAEGRSDELVLLRQLIERYPGFLPLKLEFVRLCADRGRYEEAIEVARDAMLSHPNAIEPAWLAAEASAAAGRWEDSARAAQEWRKRTNGRSKTADLMLANAQVRLGRHTEALQTIGPHLAATWTENEPQFSRLRAIQAEALAGSGRFDEAAELVEPLLNESAPWRVEWMRFAAAYPPIADARSWLEKTETLTPEDAVNERTALAAAWYNLSNRTGEMSFHERARDVLDGLAHRSDVSGQALLALAIVAEQQGDRAAAEENYRRALEIQPGLPVARNNLAMLFVDHGENLEKALELAQDAVNAEPRNPNFRDTLAQCYLALGETEAARLSLARAAELEPANPLWRDRLQKLKESGVRPEGK